MRLFALILLMISLFSSYPLFAFPVGARYLIITHDSFYEAVLPLAEWKTEKGMLAKVVKTSETGQSQSQIKAYIQNAYNTWDVPPEYVLLVGSQYHIPFPSSLNDHYYAMLDQDIFDDVMIGRFPATNLTQVQTMVAKVLGYEKTPYMEDTLWFRKGTTIVREDFNTPEDDSIYWSDAHYAAGLMVEAGYVHVDSFSNSGGDDASDVIAAINDGRTFVLYRGQGVGNWWSPFSLYPSSTTNGFKLPVVISATCATLAYTFNDLGEQFLRVGTPTFPKGAVGFIGTSTILSHVAPIRSAIAKGFFRAVFENRNFVLGDALDGARRYLYNLFGPISDYYGFTLYGDPELNLWTGTPEELLVTFPPAIPSGNYEYSVNVSSSQGPVLDALVCIMLDTLIYEYGYTNEFGNISFTISLPGTGTLKLTVTAHNFLPFQDSSIIITQGPFITLSSFSLSELSGNGDNLINPGESFYLNINAKNFGTDTAFNLSCLLNSNDPLINLIDSTEYIGNLPPGDSITIPQAFSFHISPSTRDGHDLNFNLSFYDTQGDTWNSTITNLTVFAAKLSIIEIQFIDSLSNGNGLPEPGELIEIIPTFSNTGHADVNNLTFHLLPGDTNFSVSDPIIFIGNLSAGDTAFIPDDPLRGIINPSYSSGTTIELSGEINGYGETYTYIDTLLVQIPIISSTLPTGPDNYGYYAYDDTDSPSGQSPTFDWTEIAPPGPGQIISEITNEDADTVTLPLPFTFKYYGIDYDSIGICSNGFLELGKSTYRLGTNDPIPTQGGPKRMLAPFWCDLDPSQSGDIYQWYDETNHRWIVEFKGVVHYGGSYPETFQAILLDPLYYPTPTGDGEIIFQYLTVSNPNNCTIGIEDHTETNGIQYLYNSSYPPSAAPLINHRAIKFSVNTPIGVSAPWIIMDPLYTIIDTINGDNDGIPEPGESISLNIILRNWGDISADAVEATLKSNDNACSIFDSTAFYGTILPGDSSINTQDPFSLSIPSSPSDTILDLSLFIKANYGEYENLLLFSIPLNYNVGISEKGKLPSIFKLSQNYPNPWQDKTSIAFSIPKRTKVEINIYDILGRKVKTLLNEIKEPGSYTISWDGKDSKGRNLPSGVYFFKIITNSTSSTKKMIIIRD